MLEKSISQHIYEKAEIKYKNAYDKCISQGYITNIAIFCATTTKKLEIMDFTSGHDNILLQIEYYNYVFNNVKVLLEETRLLHKRGINKMLNYKIRENDYAKQLINYRVRKCICNESMNYCDHCGGLSNTESRVKLIEALNNATAEHERIFDIFSNEIKNEINNEQNNEIKN